jgi:hypothetical protein
MADSIQEQIIKQIAARLAEITVAAGYANTIKSVQRHQLTGIETSDVPTLVIQEGDSTADLSKSVFPSIFRRMEVFIIIVTTQDPADSRSGGEILNSLVADVERCVAVNRRWNELARDTEPPMYLTTDLDAVLPHLSKGLRFEVLYEHVRNDPYAQA